jgi:hypothetical protein
MLRPPLDKCVFLESAFIDVVACDNAGKGSDAMPSPEECYTGADGLNGAGYVAAGDAGEFLDVQALLSQHVGDRVGSHGMVANEKLVGGGVGDWTALRGESGL